MTKIISYEEDNFHKAGKLIYSVSNYFTMSIGLWNLPMKITPNQILTNNL